MFKNEAMLILKNAYITVKTGLLIHYSNAKYPQLAISGYDLWDHYCEVFSDEESKNGCM